MTHSKQTSLFEDPPLWNKQDEKKFEESIYNAISQYLTSPRQPSANELLEHLEKTFGWKVRHFITQIIQRMRDDQNLQRYLRDYLKTALSEEELQQALLGNSKPKKEYRNIFEELMQQSAQFRQSSTFREMIKFVAKFRAYAPYNNMLVRIQNPACSYYATASDWQKRFDRQIKEDARPMLILAPMSPVMLVYDLDSTDGGPLPEKIEQFARTEGNFNQRVFNYTLDNAVRDKILVQFKNLSSTNAGFATSRLQDKKYKMRIVINEQLDEKSCYSIICHELAHIYLGHLGTDVDNWWPCRFNLNHRTVEIEAEAVAYIVASRAGLLPSSAGYLSGYLTDGEIPESVSIDLICKVAGRLENMGVTMMPIRKSAKKRSAKRRASST
jgi:hypothetical protein